MCDACRTVTIIDDDTGLLAALRFSFEVEGYVVRTYRSAEAYLGDPALPDRGCLIVDFHLGGIDGLELLHRLRLRGAALPAVLIATPSAGVTRRAAEAAVPLIEKPLMTDAVFDKVRAMLRDRCALVRP